MSRPLISLGNSRAATAARSLCGLSRGRSATALLPRPDEERSAQAETSGAPGDHPMSVAMPDSPANSGEADRPLAGHKVRVMLPLPLPEPLDYLMPEGAAAPEPGSFVCVGLGSRRVIGVVWEEAGEESDSALPIERLKPIVEILPTPLLRPELRRLVERVALYTLSAPGAVLRMAMSVEEALLPPPPRRVCAATPAGLAALLEPSPQKPLTASRRRVLKALRDGSAWSIAEAARRAGCGAAVVRGLIAAGHVGELLLPDAPRSPPQGEWNAPGLKLSPDQRAAAHRLVERTGAGDL